jgi:undecaprenyl-diphosphatase
MWNSFCIHLEAEKSMTEPEHSNVAKGRAPAKETKLRRLEFFLERPLLIALLCSIACGWLFAGIADEIREKSTQQWDDKILLMFRRTGDLGNPIGPNWLKDSALSITAMGSATVLAFVIFGVAGFLLAMNKWRAMWLVLASSLGGEILSLVLKTFFGRDRPTIVPHLIEVHSSSFPSGHSMMSAVVYLTLGALVAQFIANWRGRAYVILVSITLTILIGLSRVYLGVHYPTDVAAGWCAGLLWATLCVTISRWLQDRGKVEPPGVSETVSSQP